eukprot:GHVU01227270.1.p1 GENE.GHVU01227270.1~~GHVU01227270.1.p1  ORF type:complete len:106 (+),score=15.40 GHVU01227270.1:462-779(+)
MKAGILPILAILLVLLLQPSGSDGASPGKAENKKPGKPKSQTSVAAETANNESSNLLKRFATFVQTKVKGKHQKDHEGGNEINESFKYLEAAIDRVAGKIGAATF